MGKPCGDECIPQEQACEEEFGGCACAGVTAKTVFNQTLQDLPMINLAMRTDVEKRVLQDLLLRILQYANPVRRRLHR